jgi:hypothetical protein
MDALELSHKAGGADTEDDFKNGAPVADQNIVWVRGAPAHVGLIDLIGPNGGKGQAPRSASLNARSDELA